MPNTAKIVSYDQDVVLWAHQQAQLLLNKDFSALDLSHLAEEIEDVGKSEQRELVSRMAVLIAHLLKWKLQPERQGSSWQATIKVQRKDIARRLKKTPSLKADLNDPEWLESVWGDAMVAFNRETELFSPEEPIWTVDQIRNPDFYPS